MMLSPLSDDPTFVLSPSEWDFGRVMINTTASQAFTITNGGGGTLTVTGLSPMSVGPFTIMDAPVFPVSLTLGETATFNIQYAPTTAGEHTATFIITDGRATTELVVDGECFDPAIGTFPYLQNFDGDWVGTPASPEGWTVVNANADGYTIFMQTQKSPDSQDGAHNHFTYSRNSGCCFHFPYQNHQPHSCSIMSSCPAISSILARSVSASTPHFLSKP